MFFCIGLRLIPSKVRNYKQIKTGDSGIFISDLKCVVTTNIIQSNRTNRNLLMVEICQWLQEAGRLTCLNNHIS